MWDRGIRQQAGLQEGNEGLGDGDGDAKGKPRRFGDGHRWGRRRMPDAGGSGHRRDALSYDHRQGCLCY